MKITLSVVASILSLSATAQTSNASPGAGAPPPVAAGARGGRGGFGTGGFVAPQMLAQADKDADLKLTHDEFTALADNWFDKLDSDKAGKLSAEQFAQRFGNVLPPSQGGPGGAPPGGGQRAGGGRGGFGGGRLLGPRLFTVADANKDGSLTREELKATFEKWFVAWDTGKSGSLNEEKLRAGLNAAFPPPSSARENPAGFGPAAAREQTKKLKTPENLELTLFASEPMVRNPTDLDIDARGRIWLTEGVNYRSSFQRWGRLRPDGDRILILEDTDGDGVADKEKTFYQGHDINAALGICVLGNKVIVSCSPNVFVFTDEDGDDKADKKEVLFTGIKGADHDHGVHAFVFGPDGKLYFNFGNAGGEIHRPDGSVVKDVEGNEVTTKGQLYRQGLVFRCNLDGSEFEVLAHNFRNNYEVAVDSFGTLWQSDNDDDGNQGVRINYVMEFGNFGYSEEMTGAGWRIGWNKAQSQGAPGSERVFYEWHQYDPGVVPNLLHTGAGSPTGICVYEGKLLPDVFRNQVIHCDAGPRAVRAYPVTEDGAGYKARIENIITTDDTWFRPSDVAVAPDGSLYAADWNDAGVGGHNMVDQKLETMTGRVYRVAPNGHKPSAPRLDLATAAGCVQALQSPNQATRYLAWTKLHAMPSEAENDLLTLWKSGEPRMRARALHLLARIKGQEKKYVEQALQDTDANIRVAGLRIARSLKLGVIPYVKMVAQDSSAQVRRECAIALRHNSSAEAAQLWAALAQQHDGKDRWYLEALGIGADQQWDKFLNAWLAAVGDRWNTPGGRDVVWRSRGKKTPGLLVKIINDKETEAKERERYMRSFDFIQGPEKDAALVELLTSAAGAK